jgi:8-oxo-dGTP diphosphatase
MHRPIPVRADDLAWTGWQATDLATLVFVVCGGRILLIRKKRGLGAGKINGPGGRLDPGETPADCAVREMQEELRAAPLDLEQLGELRFQFVDGYAIHVFVFRASALEGEPRETDEATPIWADLGAIPYDEMWADDRIWLPLLIDRRRFSGRFVFDGDRMLDHVLQADGAWPPHRR